MYDSDSSKMLLLELMFVRWGMFTGAKFTLHLTSNVCYQVNAILAGKFCQYSLKQFAAV